MTLTVNFQGHSRPYVPGGAVGVAIYDLLSLFNNSTGLKSAPFDI